MDGGSIFDQRKGFILQAQASFQHDFIQIYFFMPNYKPEWIDRHPEVDMNATDLARKYTHKQTLQRRKLDRTDKILMKRGLRKYEQQEQTNFAQEEETRRIQQQQKRRQQIQLEQEKREKQQMLRAQQMKIQMEKQQKQRIFLYQYLMQKDGYQLVQQGVASIRIIMSGEQIDIRKWMNDWQRYYATIQGVTLTRADWPILTKMVLEQPTQLNNDKQKIFKIVPHTKVAIITDYYRGQTFIGIRQIVYYDKKPYATRRGFNLTQQQWDNFKHKYFKDYENHYQKDSQSSN